MMPEQVAQIRHDICHSANCSEFASLNFNDPCESCPNGHFGRYEETKCDDENREIPQGLGDLIATVAQPIARGIDRILGTNIQGCGGCNKRRIWLNKL